MADCCGVGVIQVPGDSLGDEFKGYIFRITGGNDKQGTDYSYRVQGELVGLTRVKITGFPMKQGGMFLPESNRQADKAE